MPWRSVTGRPRTIPVRVPNPLHCDSVSFCMADVNHILKTTSFCYYYFYLPTHWLKVPAEEIGSWFCLRPCLMTCEEIPFSALFFKPPQRNCFPPAQLSVQLHTDTGPPDALCLTHSTAPSPALPHPHRLPRLPPLHLRNGPFMGFLAAPALVCWLISIVGTGPHGDCPFSFPFPSGIRGRGRLWG